MICGTARASPLHGDRLLSITLAAVSLGRSWRAPTWHRCACSREARARCHVSASAMRSGSHGSVLWFRNDLRVTDHPALLEAATSQQLACIYCLDDDLLRPRPCEDGSAAAELPVMGPHRCRFLLESLTSLRQDLEARGSTLQFSTGNTAAVVAAAVQQLAVLCGSVRLHYQLMLDPAEQRREDAVKEAAAQAARESGALGATLSVHPYWGATLYHPTDLPASMQPPASGAAPECGPLLPPGSPEQAACTRDRIRFSAVPSTMTQFRKAVEASGKVRIPVPAPVWLPPPPSMAEREITDDVPALYAAAGASDALERLGSLTSFDMRQLPRPSSGVYHQHAAFKQVGGERAGIQRLKYYIWGADGDTTSPAAAVESRAAVASDSKAGQTGGADSSSIESYGGSGAVTAGTVGLIGQLRAQDKGLSREDDQIVSGSGQRHAELESPCGGGGNFQTGRDPAGPSREAEGYTAEAGGLSPAYTQMSADIKVLTGAELGGCRAEGAERARQAPLHNFKETRMLAGGEDSSTHLSAYLALGCLSPRMLHAELTAAATQLGPAQCEWLLMHLIIRDFFIFTALKAGQDLLRPEGIAGKPVDWRPDEAATRRWAAGRTGLPFVDASMRELAATGYMSNRGRQNVAGLFCKDLGLDWRIGAQLFGSLLVDHDWAVNTANWAYFAGVGNDPRDRHFNTVSQGEKYDTKAELISAWVPELASLMAEARHRPWDSSVASSLNYPTPIVDAITQINRPKT